MNLRKAKVPALLCVSLLTLVGCNHGSSGNTNTVPGETKVIYVDGGGDIGDYNTTSSMTASDSNPFPYNTLETLCNEWSAAHPGYQVKINKTSAHGDRAILLPQLKMKNACHIIYQNGTVINSDLGEDYYVDLTNYLEKENPYLDGNAKWKTVYNEAELATTQASDGHYYYVNLEKNPVCFMYNKTILREAGLDPDELDFSTLAKFCDILSQVDSYLATKPAAEGYGTYSTLYTWYQLALETNMFSDLIKQGDVIRQNNLVDMEELCRLYKKGIFAPEAVEGNRYYELIKLIQKLDAYKEPASYAASQSWVAGKLAFMEATGQHLRTYSKYSAEDLGFEWGTFSFPDISLDDYGAKQLDGVVRGTAGLATSWWISNTAVEDGTTEACVDLLMYLTAPKQNNRLVGDLGGGIPLNPDENTPIASYLEPLIEQYNQDVNDEGRVCWTAFSPRSVLGTSFGDAFIRAMQDLDAGTSDLDSTVSTLCRTIKNTINASCVEYDYPVDEWLAE